MSPNGICPCSNFHSAVQILKDTLKYNSGESPELAAWLSRFVFQHAFGRARFAGAEIGGVAEQRRALGADDLVGVAKIEEHMRMVERRIGPDTHEFARADFDEGHACIVLKVGDDVIGHDGLP